MYNNIRTAYGYGDNLKRRNESIRMRFTTFENANFRKSFLSVLTYGNKYVSNKP